MIIKGKTAIAKVSDLRYELDEILAQVKDSPVELEKHSKPVAILVDPKRFAEMEAKLEQAEDILLAFEARDRELSAKGKGYLTLEQIEKRLR